MAPPFVTLCKDSYAVAAQGADFVSQCAREAIGERGRFTLVLAGGSTPDKMYQLLAEPPRRAAIEWPKTYVFFGDERFVPPADAHSNWAMAERTLLAHVPVPRKQVFPISTQESSAAAAAAAYAADLARFISARRHDGPPRFDLVLLGLGEDGHTASLFPRAPALHAKDAWVTWSPPGLLPPAVDRVTMTFSVFNAARHVAFLVTGAKKAAVLRDVLEGHPTLDSRPATGVQPADGTLTWFVDEDAARLLTQDTRTLT